MSIARTTLLLAGLTGLFLAIGYLIGGEGGMMIAFMLALGTNAFAYWNSDRMVLSMYGAREVDAGSAPRYYSLVEQLARRAGLPMPRVYLIDSPQPNAFATGRDPNHAAVAATTGLLDMLSEHQVAGVMAHELAHIRNRDTLIMTITATLAGAIGMLANFALFFGGSRGNDENDGGNPLGAVGAILLMVLAPLAAMLVQMAISRTREYAADRAGAEICGRPEWLADALARLESGAHAIANPVAESNPATAHLFIVNPLHGRGMDNLFSTHPAMANRIARLQAMAQGGEQKGREPEPTRPGHRGPWNRGPWG